ncbi:TPA: hypothetical protein R9C50_001434 [Escherichia coli]|nr:hypothetical protein [Escherichia coli]
MARKMTLLVLSAIFVTQVVYAESSDNWIEVTTNKDGAFLVKKGTFKNVKGDSSALFMYEKSDKKVEYYKISMKNADCDNGFGEVKFFYMDGSLAFKGDYVADGNSVGAGLGDFLCGVRIAANAQKS